MGGRRRGGIGLGSVIAFGLCAGGSVGCAVIDGFQGTDGGSGPPSIDGGGQSDAAMAPQPDADGPGGGGFPLRLHGQFSAGASPVALAVGNHPTPSDVWIASVNETANQVTMLSHAAGQAGDLGISETLPVGGGPTDAVMADFNGDGLDDLAVVCRDASEVYVFFQTGGSPAFSAPVVLSSPQSGPQTITAGDVNDDDALDVVVSAGGFVDGPVAFLRGADPTAFESATSLGLAFPMGDSIAAGDIDGDGRDDIAGGEGLVVVMFQDAGAFQLSQDELMVFPRDVGVAVLDPGASASMLIASMGDISVWQRDPVNARRLVERSTLLGAVMPEDMAVGRISAGDDHLDIVSVGANLSLYVRTSAATTPAATHHLALSTPHSAVAVADVDADGRDDIVVANPQTATVSVYLNDGDPL